MTQIKRPDTDGYAAIQIAFKEISADKAGRPAAGHFAKAGVEPTRRLVEFHVGAEDETSAGATIDVSMFEENDFVDIVGTSKGKGFQGVMKRHGFGGGRASHGSMFHRAPGSVGQSAYPSRVFPGMRFPGQDGNRRVTTKNVKVVRVDAEENLLFVKGPVPGARNSYVAIRPAKKG